MGDTSKLINGPAVVSIDGINLGFTSTDGVSLSHEFEDVDFEGDQTVTLNATNRTKIMASVSCAFHELSQENLAILLDLEAGPTSGVLEGRWPSSSRIREIVFTSNAGPGKQYTWTMAGTVSAVETLSFNRRVYTGLPTTFKLLDLDGTNKYWRCVETSLSSTVPAVSTFAAGLSGTDTTFVDGATNVGAATSLLLTFNTALRVDMAKAANFSLFTDTGNTAISLSSVAFGTTSGATDYAKVRLNLASALSAGTGYKLFIGGQILSASNVRVASPTKVDFTTAS